MADATLPTDRTNDQMNKQGPIYEPALTDWLSSVRLLGVGLDGRYKANNETLQSIINSYPAAMLSISRMMRGMGVVGVYSIAGAGKDILGWMSVVLGDLMQGSMVLVEALKAALVTGQYEPDTTLLPSQAAHLPVRLAYCPIGGLPVGGFHNKALTDLLYWGEQELDTEIVNLRKYLRQHRQAIMTGELEGEAFSQSASLVSEEWAGLIELLLSVKADAEYYLRGDKAA